jgi:hypothetical protein
MEPAMGPAYQVGLDTLLVHDSDARWREPVVGAVDALGKRKAFEDLKKIDGGSWAWGQRALTRISELRTLANLMARLAGNENQDAAALAEDARQHLRVAKESIEPPDGGSSRRTSGWVDRVVTNTNAAACLIIRFAPLREVQAMLPDLVAIVDEQLPAGDLRRINADDILRRIQKANGTKPAGLTEEERGGIVVAVRAAYSALEREYVRIRSFRNIVFGVTACLAIVAAAIALTTAVHPTVLPICFTPESKVVCATGEAPFAGGDLDDAAKNVVSRWDYIVLEVVGLVAAAIAAAAALRQINGTSTPFAVPVALAVLKLPTGALTAVLGLLLMRGQFVPGLSNLDTSAQILAWAVVFGYAQQLFTRLVDERGQAVLQAVGGPENHNKT